MACTLQMGGSDQWGNIVSGVELVRRTEGAAVFGLTTPLIATASGAKMGKTAAGRGLAHRRAAVGCSTTGSSGATPRTPMSAASCACSPICPWPRSPGWRRSVARRSTRPRRCWPPRRPPFCMAAPAAEAAAEAARSTFEEGAAAAALPQVSIPAAEVAAAMPAFRLFVLRRSRRQQCRGAPPGARRRRAAGRCSRSPTRAKWWPPRRCGPG